MSDQPSLDAKIAEVVQQASEAMLKVGAPPTEVAYALIAEGAALLTTVAGPGAASKNAPRRCGTCGGEPEPAELTKDRDAAASQQPRVIRKKLRDCRWRVGGDSRSLLHTLEACSWAQFTVLCFFLA